jgi:DNA-binding GntR family transcriptional regulator
MPNLSKLPRIIETLRTQIQQGDYGKYGRLPSRVELAKQFQTTTETINKAIAHLQAEGLLTSSSTGKAVSINPIRTRVQGIASRFDLLLQQQGLTVIETNIAPPEKVSAMAVVADIFDIKEGTPLVRRYRRQGTEDTPYRLAENYYPANLVNDHMFSQVQQNERFDVLQAIKETYGKVIVRVHEDVLSRLPTKQEQELLQLVQYSPVLEVRRTCYAEDNTVVMFNRLLFVANLFVLSYDYLTDHWKH